MNIKYKIISKSSINPGAKLHRFSEVGNEGWVLICFDGDDYIFKKEE